ncbi:MAG: RnfABCDGE type electron transport complex subunit B [Treponema sp.]|nr:RnfABCDGE type electron transport complex subunit B [Treponema sp.]
MIYTTVFSVTAMGIICATVLCVASKLMYVKTDERVAKLIEALPGVNCGACGYPGCSGYAAALLSGGTSQINLCTPGGAEVMAKLSAILGVEAGSMEKKTAVVKCLGDCASQKKKMDYMGIQSCAGAKQLYGGEGACAFGCLGYGDCQKACPSGAICTEDDLARVIAGLCTGCGLCVKSCPNNLIAVENASLPGSAAPVFVLCKNIEKGAVTRKKCAKGCIACGKCARECSAQAITMADNLAVINYGKCTGCGHCAQVCVSKCIQSTYRSA